ncbi:MAG: 4Fe-4S binding protein [Armatimonadetes bacterium]|nr:4Fe-4S binding protein [Armatimonadota bacterium]
MNSWFSGFSVSERRLYIDPSRCIGCNACVEACAECDTHAGISMIHLETIQRGDTVQTTPVLCMHCDEPACAAVCPADAIKRTPDGVVHTSLKPRCIGCSNCVFACPFGVPKYHAAFDQMIKCDMCYDRSSIGKKPMCATVCPSQAIMYATPEEVSEMRGGTPINEFIFGSRTITTKVHLMMPKGNTRLEVRGSTTIRKSDLLNISRTQ